MLCGFTPTQKEESAEISAPHNMDILLTNDDGIRALGIRTLYHELVRRKHNVHVVAPMRQQSGVSQCLTIFEPLRVTDYEDDTYKGHGVYGTPADCVKVALGALLSKTPDLVVSGINLGANVGPDLFYSGTVAAAIEGSQAGIASLAVSYDDHHARDLSAQAAHVADLITRIPWQKLASQRVINVNYPACPIGEVRGMRVCPQSPAVWENVYQACRDPRGMPYFWLVGDIKEENIGEHSDKALLAKGYITISPLRFDFTDSESLSLLRSHLGE